MTIYKKLIEKNLLNNSIYNKDNIIHIFIAILLFSIDFFFIYLFIYLYYRLNFLSNFIENPETKHYQSNGNIKKKLTSHVPREN